MSERASEPSSTVPARGAELPQGGSAVKRRMSQVFWLTVVWVLLWGTVRPATIVGGVIVAVLVAWLFPLPPMRDALPLRPVRLVALAGFLLVDLLRSGAQVGWETLRSGRQAAACIVAVPLLAGSARVVALLAAAVVLSPGSYVLQIDRVRGTFWVYALGVRGDGAVERVRRDVLAVQRKVIAAFGTPAELAACDQGRATGQDRSPA